MSPGKEQTTTDCRLETLYLSPPWRTGETYARMYWLYPLIMSFDPLKNLQSDIKSALSDPNVSAEEIVDIVKSTLLLESSKARAIQSKCTDALEKLKVPAVYSASNAPEYLTNPSSNRWTMVDKDGKKLNYDDLFKSVADDVFVSNYGAAQPVDDGIMGGAGQDTITFW